MASSKEKDSSTASSHDKTASGKFTSEISIYIPGIGYSQQELPSSVNSGPPPEKIASTIHAFRQLFTRRSYFPVKDLVSIRQTREFMELNLSTHFRSKEDIESFLKTYPQYFAFTNGRIHLPHNFTRDGLMEYLEKHRTPSKSRNPVPYKLIESVEDCKIHVTSLKSRALQGTPLVVAMDCEGVKLGKDGPLTLLQLGTVEGEVFIFDILATPNKKDMFINGGLKGILEDDKILKVIHDSRNDACALHFQFGVTLTNVFDTSTAFTTLWDQCNVSGEPRRPKLTALLEVFSFKAKHKTDSFISQIHNNKLFGERPLTKQMLEYASDDVLCLVSGMYETMNRLLSPLWRPFFEEEVKRDLRESRIRDPYETYLMRKRQRFR
ncbi:Egalitarian protein-like [Holothuria leucospilota]|uniref:Egalitarian protein-like n=1 Tax=Holothuria leucospilota TaxID=206669 RepID=A0A9Q1CLZ5_HOLLE|nr:Egalitarian protein-like [Holothuria leucospilota]